MDKDSQVRVVTCVVRCGGGGEFRQSRNVLIFEVISTKTGNLFQKLLQHMILENLLITALFDQTLITLFYKSVLTKYFKK